MLTKSSLDSSSPALLFAFRFLLNRLLVFLFMTLSVSSFNSLLSVSWFPFLLLASNFEFFAKVFFFFFFRLGSVITVPLLIRLLLLIIIIVSNYTNTKHPIGKRRVLSSTIISFFSPGKKTKRFRFQNITWLVSSDSQIQRKKIQRDSIRKITYQWFDVLPQKRNELWRKNDIPPRKFHDPIRILPRFPSVFYYQLDTRMFNEKLRSKIEFEMVVIVVFYSDF